MHLLRASSDVDKQASFEGDELLHSSTRLLTEKTLIINEDKRTLTAGGLVVMIYFWTCGGPFGIESAVGAGGAAITFISLIFIAFFWLLPQALMAAELSLMTNLNGGNVAWVQRAFGDFLGLVNAACALTMNLDNQAILVVLFLDYLPNGISDEVKWSIRIGLLTISTLINIWSVQWISRISWFLLFLVFAPFFAQVVATVVYDVPIDFNALLVIPPMSEINWGLLISTVVWSFGGLDLIGFVAGEVEGGRKTFLNGVFGSFPIILLNYVFPVTISYSVDPVNSHWDAGYFVTLTENFFPQWLSLCMRIATCMGIIGMLLSAGTTTSRLIWAMAKGKEDNVCEHRYLPKIFAWSSRGFGGPEKPVAAILANAVLALGVSAFTYNFLVQFFLVLRIANLLFEYASLICLKFTEPDTVRPFEVPFGKVGAILSAVPTVVMCLVAAVTSDWQVLVSGGTVLVTAVFLYGLKLTWLTYMRWKRKNKL